MGPMVSRATPIITLFLMACTSQVEEAERRYEMVKRAGGSGEERCERAKDVANAYLETGNDHDYQFHKLSADVVCQRAKLDRLNGIVRGPDESEIVLDKLDAQVDAAIANATKER
jgi:hypothetical protein